MKAKTKQRARQLHELFVNTDPETWIGLEEFISLTKATDDTLWMYIKNVPDSEWDRFLELMDYKPGKFQFDWSCLPAWSNKYIAMDENGIWYCYSAEPSLDQSQFSGAYYVKIPKLFWPENFKGSWKESLTKNPKL
jgi:hypothetical protein